MKPKVKAKRWWSIKDRRRANLLQKLVEYKMPRMEQRYKQDIMNYYLHGIRAKWMPPEKEK